MKSNIKLLIIISYLFFSCNDELNVNPQQHENSDVTLNTEQGIINVLNGTYAIAAKGDVYGGKLLIASDLLGISNDDGPWIFDGTSIYLDDIFNKEIKNDNYIGESIYKRNYEIINATNTVIENIDKVKSLEKQKTMIGEANFLRSMAYFDLVRLFALPYESTKNNTQLGVVIRDKAIYNFNTDLSKERSSVEEVYNLIIDGLKLASLNLPEKNSFYANKYAAKALLARVYLQQEKYTEARDLANEVIQSGNYSLSKNYDEAFNHDVDQPEDIFAIQVTKQTGSNQMTYYYGARIYGGRYDIYVTDTYLNAFDDPNDVRRNFYYIDEILEEKLTSKYTNEFGNITLLRLAEMYLIRAETNFRLGTNIGDTPLNDINKLRNRAIANLLTSLTLETILNERLLELAMEGFAIHDLKRTKKSVDNLEYNSNCLVFPIPLIEMDTNKLITQNPNCTK